MPRRIWIASPVEPSGASWILNCLLELGIVVHHRPVERNVFRRDGGMWIAEGDGVRLHPRAGVLAKWMPALAAREIHRFRDDVEVVYVQEPPPAERPAGPGLVFVRDPRDAIWSGYRRLDPEIDFAAFVAWPNHRTLLDRPAQWARFVDAWMARPGALPIRFEDYKRDDTATLASALAHLELPCSREQIEAAAAASTFDRARDAEERYRREHPRDQVVANRAGRVGDYRGRPELDDGLARIDAATSEVRTRLGYGGDATARARPALDREALVAFARRLDPDLAARARLAAHEARELVAALGALAPDDRGLADHLRQLAPAFAEGGAYHGRQLAALFRSRSGAAHG